MPDYGTSNAQVSIRRSNRLDHLTNEMAEPRKIVLVTGSHRSGTTWVGKVLASGPRSYYLQEPFNPNNASSKLPMTMTYWFQRLRDRDDSVERDAFRRMFDLNIPWPSGSLRDFRYIAALPKSTAIAVREKIRARRARFIVMKDPIALLSADWLARNFGALPVVLIRHPAAFVSSIRIKGWYFDFNNLLLQPDVIDEFFPEERETIERTAKCQFQDIISEGAIQWRLVHKVILKFRSDFADWQFVRHKDISIDPHVQFAALFQKLGIPFTQRVQRYLNTTSRAAGTDYIAESTPESDVARDSAENVRVWKHRLSRAEIERIRAITGEVSTAFYSDSEW